MKMIARKILLLLTMLMAGMLHAETIRVNIGGGVYTDVSGNSWSADGGCNTGNLGSVSAPVGGTLDEFLFLTHRWDSGGAPEMTCSYALQPGDYQVTLYFAETNSNNFFNGARLFDVNIEGTLVFNDIDIYREAGGNTALLKTTTVTVDGGQLDIQFLHQAKNPLVKAIEIIPLGGGGNTPPVITTSPVTGATVGVPYSYDVDATDNPSDTLQYFLDVAPASMTIDPNSGVISWAPLAGDEGPQSVTVRVQDQGGLEDTQSYTLSVGSGSAVQQSVHVNIGGGAYTDVSGNSWSADGGCNTGNLGSVSAPVGGTLDEFLFLTHRWDSGGAPEMTCSYALQPGDYQVTLYFAETNSNNFFNSARLFDVNIEGTLVFNDIDIYREAGGNTALLKTTTVTVDGGQLDIQFLHQAKNPLIKAIAIVPAGNSPPVISTPPVTTATVDTAYSYDVNVSDDAGDTQQYFLDVAPTSMSIGLNSGVISWLPGSGDEGPHAVTVRVRDQGGLEDTQSYTLIVSAAVGNNPPIISTAPVTTATAGDVYSYDVNVTDDVGDTQQYFLDVAPASMSIDLNSGVVSWLPGTGDEGPHAVTVRVRDQGGLEDTQSYTLNVSAAVGNNPPIISTAPVTTVTAGEVYSYDVNVTDDVGDTQQYFLDVAPASMSIDLNSGVVSWLPGTGDEGPHAVTIRVRDQGGLEDTQFYTLNVSAAVGNNPPVISTAPVAAARAGEAYSYDVNVTDDVGDTQQYFLDVAPASMSVGLNSGVISWLPGSSDEGPHAVTVRVQDQGGLEDTQSYMLNVGSADQQPVRVNIGGGAYTDSAGNLWSADSGCNTGILNTIAGPIQGTPDEFLFLSTRWDDAAVPEMTCSYAVSPGLYEVTLYFTESYSRNFQNGARVFDVVIEGLLKFDNLDIYREAGANTALLKTTTVSVTDGQINIQFLHQIKNPLIRAIQIRELPIGACSATARTQALNGVLPVSGGTGSETLLFSIPSGGNGSLGTATITDATTGQFWYQPDGSGWGSDSFQYQVEGLPGGTVTNTYTVIVEPRIMPLGDSITSGIEVSGDGASIVPTPDLRVGWRLPLYNDLVAEGYAFDFVGGRNHGWSYSPFDSDHEGHGGWTATDIAWGQVGHPTDGVRAWLDANPADIVLLHAGTNGLVAGGDIEVEAILDEIDVWESSPGGNPVMVILAQIIDQNPINPDVTTFNANLLSMADDRISNPAFPDDIVVIDQQSALTYPDDLQDNLHPKPAGYVKMKDRWKGPLNMLLPFCP